MAKYLALIVPVVVGLLDTFSGQITALVSAHPSWSVVIGAISVIVAALTKSVLPSNQ